MYLRLLELIKLIFGKNAINKTIGTRTNVIQLPNNKIKRYIKEDLNIEAASDAAAMNAKKEMEELIAEIPKMNDAERLIFEGNLRRLKNRLGIRSEKDPTADVYEFGTKLKATPKGIETLTEQAGQKSPPGTVMGNLESRLNRLKASGKDLGDIAKEEGGVKFSIPEKGIFNQELSADNLFDTIIKQQERFRKIQNSGLITSTAREILQRDIKAGKLKLPKEIEDRIMLVDGNPGTVNPVEVFRTNYGEDALEQLDSLIPELANAQSYSDLVKIVEKKYPMKPLAKPRKETMDLDEAAKAEEENILIPKKPDEPEEFATGGIVNRTGFKFGTKLGRFWKIAKKVWDDINPTGDRKYDAQLVADELAEEIFKTSMDDLPQKVQIDLYALAYNNAPKVDALFTNPQSLSEAAKKGMAASKEMESLGLDVTKSSDFFKYQEMKLSGQLGPEHQVQAYKDKIRDEFYGMIDDTLMKQVEVDDNPQRLAEVYASIKEGLEMQRKGMTPEEIIRVMKQTPRTKNAIGGRVGYADGGSKGLDYLMGVDRKGYANGSYEFIKTLPKSLSDAINKFGIEAVFGEEVGGTGESPGTYVPGKYTPYYNLMEAESGGGTGLKDEYLRILEAGPPKPATPAPAVKAAPTPTPAQQLQTTYTESVQPKTSKLYPNNPFYSSTFGVPTEEDTSKAMSSDISVLYDQYMKNLGYQSGGRVGYEAGGVSIDVKSLPATATAAINQFGQDMFNELNLQQYYYAIGATGDADQGAKKPIGLVPAGTVLPPKPGTIGYKGPELTPVEELETTYTTNVTPSDDLYPNNPFYSPTFGVPTKEDTSKEMSSDISVLYDQYMKNLGYKSGGRVGYSDGTKPSAEENTPSQAIINRMIAQIKQMSKMGADIDTIKTITGASDQMIKDVLGKASGGSVSKGLDYLIGY